MSVTAQQVEAGQAIYTRRTLRVYDLVVLGVSNAVLWKCPTQRLLRHYDRHVTPNHLDAGVGTGYFLDRCRFPAANPRLALMDLNQHALDFAAARVSRYTPERYRRNLLEPIRIEAGPFDSVGINYLLHCLPGTMQAKAVVFDHLATLMNRNAVIFGSTLLHGGVTRSWFAQRVMKIYNTQGIFSNQTDDVDGLNRELSSRFAHVTVEIVGCAALFSARKRL